eukprot:GHVL01043425.1.p1 GENE.GHVL01043425.1~~GHVL01043425.1.p1  ORF type:complete len:501 (+),score=67.75 GHVL01043425.1:411-1913(+)
MLSVMMAVSVWINLCSYWGLPVSTTHCVVGALIGFGIAAAGVDAIKWETVSMVIVSWIISPIVSAILAPLLYLLVRKTILIPAGTDETYIARKGRIVIGLLLFSAYFIFFLLLIFKNSFELGGTTCLMASTQTTSYGFVIIDGTKEYQVGEPCQVDKWALAEPGIAIAATLGFSIFFAVITFFAINFGYKKHVIDWDPKNSPFDYHEPIESDAESPKIDETGESVEKSDKISVTASTNPDNIYEDTFQRLPGTKSIHTGAEKHPARAERLFQVAQIITACLASVAHGSNDVANASGPLTAVWSTFRSGQVLDSADLEWWVMLVASLGICFGLLLFGRRVILAMGVGLAKMSPSRGFCVETVVAVLVLIGSTLGIPLGGTQMQVGATIGVGLVDFKLSSVRPKGLHSVAWFKHTLFQGFVAPALSRISFFIPFYGDNIREWTLAESEFTEVKSGVNWVQFIHILIAWCGCIIFAGLLSAAIFSFAAYSASARAFETVSVVE